MRSSAVTAVREWALRPAIIAASLAAGLLAAAPALAADLDKLEVFAQPGVSTDSMWMAEARGIFAEKGLDVQIRLFPSGTTAFQTFKTGAGDVIFSGDLPALQYWQNGGSYQVIAASNRDSKGYIGVTKVEIQKPEDLKGKTIATRVGSTGSYFISEYLAQNGIAEADVTVKNLDPPLMPVALCQGDIDGFFVWLPAPTKAKEICGDKVHFLTTAEGYVKGYSVFGARKEYLADPANADKVRRFVAALQEGRKIAEAEEEETIAYLDKRFGLTREEVLTSRGIMERVLKIDDVFFEDFCRENKWQQRAGLRSEPSDLGEWVWDGLKELDPTLVAEAPPPC
ncbi:ABC transporter substrate-binding protein [Mongoliimonas terrestris]|uniref:ABC transporter substrate-binding protein n=1 Tax=Mongoliimonas terrestris TaxID=1709001 RepID=UPI00094980BD|nr:NrtA/SsuA/CpmA family ABC transporter substrate-binding protein [Mongoliimonas terrestris]